MNAKRGIIVLGLLSAVSIPTWAQQIKGVVIDQNRRKLPKFLKQAFFNLKLYKKNLKKIFHILPTCFKKMHIYLQTLMS